MSYLVLARKYRPRTFADMVGQETVTQVLKGAIQEGRIGHAYLFCGPRGTGKTTTARILAKALNCERGPTIEPCLECERCLGIENGSEVDVVEIDAASHTSVDNVRDLKEQVAYAPMRARYKVWIIDEVHMLSKSAFNAFLKTLEEPPPHVKFLFATTDPQKVLETVLSRVQVLKLSPLSEATISARLATVFAREGIEPEAGVVEEIARRARGGMRDALSLADQLLSLVGTKPRLADAKALSVDSGGELVDRVLDAVVARDRAGVLSALPEGEGGEAELLGALIDSVRAHLLLGLLGADAPQVQLDASRRAAVHARARSFGLERWQIVLEELLLARERAGRMPMHARVVLESTLLDLARGDGLVPMHQLVERLAQLEARLGGSVPRPAHVVAPAPGVARSAPAAPAPLSNPPYSTPAVAPEPPRASPSEGVLRPKPPPPRASVDGPATVRDALPGSAPSLSLPPSLSPAPSLAPRGAPALSLPPTLSAPTLSAPAAAQPSGAGVATLPPPVRSAAAAPAAAPATLEAPPEAASPAAPRPVRGALSGTQDAWGRLVQDAKDAQPALGTLLAERAKLVDLDARRAVIGIKHPRESERALLADPATRALCRSLLSKILGREVDVHLQDAGSMKGRVDDYTERVARLFEGRVEDGA